MTTALRGGEGVAVARARQTAVRAPHTTPNSFYPVESMDRKVARMLLPSQVMHAARVSSRPLFTMERSSWARRRSTGIPVRKCALMDDTMQVRRRAVAPASVTAVENAATRPSDVTKAPTHAEAEANRRCTLCPCGSMDRLDSYFPSACGGGDSGHGLACTARPQGKRGLRAGRGHTEPAVVTPPQARV